jgi:hypothetical protein
LITEPRLGIYWIVRSAAGEFRLLGHACPLPVAEEYGDCLTCPSSHIDVWASWRRGYPPEADLLPLIRLHEYEAWPRGRIVYERDAARFIVYVDPKVMLRSAVVDTIVRWFALPAGQWLIRTDAHYRSLVRL